MKKLFGCILSLVVAVMLVFTPAEHVYAQGLGLSVSSSSIAVGKTVKVTVSMPSGYFGTVVISSSDEGYPAVIIYGFFAPVKSTNEGIDYIKLICHPVNLCSGDTVAQP